ASVARGHQAGAGRQPVSLRHAHAHRARRRTRRQGGRNGMNTRREDIAGTAELSDIGASRRRFLKTSGGLVLGFSLLGPTAALAAQRDKLPLDTSTSAMDDTGAFPAVNPAKLDAWIAIHPDNTATL